MEIAGLPVHPLIVHAVVVLLPLSVLLALAFAFVSSWRWLTRWLTLGCTVVGFASLYVARRSGTALLDSRAYLIADDSPLRQRVLDHQSYANLLWWVALAFLLVVVAAFALVPARTGLASGRLDHAGSTSAAVVGGLPLLLALTGIATLVLCVLTGEAGARAVWGS